MIWGIFPELFPQKNISWESHLSGMIAGIVLAVFYKDEGIQRKKYSWETEEMPDSDDDITTDPDNEPETPYWNTPEPDKDELTFVYHFKKSEQK